MIDDEMLGWVVEVIELAATGVTKGLEVNTAWQAKNLANQRAADAPLIDMQTGRLFGGTIQAQQGILSGKYTTILVAAGATILGLFIIIPMLRR